MCLWQRVHYVRCGHTDVAEVMPDSCDINRRHVDGACEFNDYSVICGVIDYDNLCPTCDPKAAERRRRRLEDGRRRDRRRRA